MLVIGLSRHVVDASTVPQMNMMEETELLQLLKRSVHTRLVDLRGMSPGLLPDLGGTQMTVATAGQDSTHGPSACGYPKTGLP